MCTDSDWIEQEEHVRCTNNGLVKQWSSSQRAVALSSCESELCAMNKRAAEAMGIRCLAADTEIAFDIITDASASLAVVNRRGVCKTRHVDTQELWLSSAIRNLELEEVSGEENVADMITR